MYPTAAPEIQAKVDQLVALKGVYVFTKNDLCVVARSIPSLLRWNLDKGADYEGEQLVKIRNLIAKQVNKLPYEAEALYKIKRAIMKRMNRFKNTRRAYSYLYGKGSKIIGSIQSKLIRIVHDISAHLSTLD